MSVTIKPAPNGPLIVTGDFKIENAEGKEVPHQGEHVALCRCGHSNNKPFCDGSHKKEGFQAA
jgi:CDGSH-type Zn-finger protein